MTVELPDDLGRPHEIEVPLPPDCYYTYAAEGDDLTLREVKKRIEKEHARVLEYLNRLARDPSFAPQVVEQLHEHGVRFHGGPMGISISTKEDYLPPQMVSDIVTKDYPMDVVRWRKQYLKIAWCFACRHLGRRALRRMGGDAVIDYLKRDRIDPVLVDLCRSADREAADAVFDEVTVGGTLACLRK